jgi:hypothetical protein
MSIFQEVSKGVFITKSGEKFTNHQSLPDEVVASVMMDRYNDDSEDPYDYSASNLTAPVQQQILKKRHKDNLRIFDVTDKFASFFGSVAHQVLEDAWHESMGSIPEERIYMTVHGKIISGKLDLYHEPEIRDYKTTKVYKVMKKLFDDWAKGQNVYAALCRVNGRPVDTITICAMMKDWSKGELYKENYPPAEIQMIPLPVWSQEDAMAYIEERVANLVEAEGIEEELSHTVLGPNDNLSRLADIELYHRFPCSQEDMWQRVKDCCILKGDSDRAVSGTVRTNEVDCYKILNEKYAGQDEYKVVTRWTKRTRCEDWCECSTVCRQDMILKGIDPDAPAPLF